MNLAQHIKNIINNITILSGVIFVMSSCDSRIKYITDYCFELKSFPGSIHFYLNSDSLYSTSLYRDYADVAQNMIYPISVGTYKKKEDSVFLTNSLSGELIIALVKKERFIPLTGSYKNHIFIEDNTNEENFDTACFDRIKNDYLEAKKKKSQMDKVKSSPYLLDSFVIGDFLHFKRDKLCLNLHNNARYKLMFEDYIFSQGAWTFTKGVIKFTEDGSNTNYVSYLLEDNTLIPGSLPFSIGVVTLQIE